MRNKRIGKIEYGKSTPKSPDDKVLWINTNNDSISRYIESTREWVNVVGSTGGSVGDLTVPTAIKDTIGQDLITFTRTGTGTARIGTPQDDLSLRSARDITLYAGDDGPGNVYIGWGDAVYTPDSPNRVATIGDIQSGTTGDVTFVGSTIIGNGTIDLVPDNTLTNDSYLIITPTDTNHIHIRAGGPSDESDSILILGGERNKVSVSDTDRSIAITTRAASVSNTYVNLNESTGAFITDMSSNIQVGD
jgi:hypothetical protein